MKERDRRILEVLAAADHDLHGSDLVTGALAPWAMYVVLASLEERGLIEGREEDDGPFPRRVYRITTAGRGHLLPTATVR
jgi:DNA-binding PadR family transcriptional regulator